MQFGLCTISNENADVETVLDLAAAAGYDGVEIWGGDHVGDDPVDCRAIGREAVDRDLAIPVFGSYLRTGTDRFDSTMERELDRTAAPGADLIRVWAGDHSCRVAPYVCETVHGPVQCHLHLLELPPVARIVSGPPTARS